MSTVVYQDDLDEDPRASTHDVMNMLMSGLTTLRSLNPTDYIKTFELTPAAQPTPETIAQAVDALTAWTFVTSSGQDIAITEEGRFLKGIPLDYPAAAVLTEARRHNLLSQMLPLVGVVQMGDMRHDTRKPLGTEHMHASEPVHQTIVVMRVLYALGRRSPHGETKQAAEENNISLRKYRELVESVQHLEKIVRRHAMWKCYLPIEKQDDRELFDILTQKMVDFSELGIAVLNRPSVAEEPQREGMLGALLREALAKKKA